MTLINRLGVNVSLPFVPASVPRDVSTMFALQ